VACLNLVLWGTRLARGAAALALGSQPSALGPIYRYRYLGRYHAAAPLHTSHFSLLLVICHPPRVPLPTSPKYHHTATVTAPAQSHRVATVALHLIPSCSFSRLRLIAPSDKASLD
jgi:hypothetical protein